MIGEIYKVDILKYQDVDKNPSGLYLCIGEKDNEGIIQFLSLRVISEPVSSNLIEINSEDLIKCTLDQRYSIDLGNTFSFNLNENSESIGAVSKEFIAKVFKGLVLKYTKAYYDFEHKPKQQTVFSKEKSKISYAGRVFDSAELINLVDSSLEFWLTTGKYAEQFERGFSKFLNVRHTLLVNSGSSANLVAFNSLTSPSLGERQIKKGDEVICVAAGFPTSINPILQYGAVPVFVDISLPTYNIDVKYLEESISNKTKAVMLAHTLGNPFDLQTIKNFCKKYNLWLVEDNCDALGSLYNINDEWHYTGTIGDIGTSSFYPPHHMTMGEGGAVYMNSNKLKRIAESIRDWGRDCWCPSGKDNTCGKRFEWELGELPLGYDHKYIYSHLGYNLKVTDLQAAIGVAQLNKLPNFVNSRIQNWQLLRDGLNELEEFFILPEPTLNSKPSWFGFLLTIRDSSPFSRAEIVNFLEEKRIQTRMLFAGNYLRHPVFNNLRNLVDYKIVNNLKVTDMVMTNTFWLGVYPGLNAEMIHYMIDSIKSFVKKRVK
ncbi:MAG: lipopolysaccharide biosynthesis protein RfbH [Leptospira sp.]|nr:lipopolysaccharide biosynthesis protein RfbH [Leptospira sp.]